MNKLLFFLTVGALAAACTSSAQSVVDAAQLESMIQKDKTLQLVDIRTPGEWQQTGIIKGASRINFHDADFKEQISKLDKEKAVVLYCAAGGRSPRAAAALTQMGFKKVYDYAGGMSDWLAKGKPTVR